jgi:hypothetical protein
MSSRRICRLCALSLALLAAPLAAQHDGHAPEDSAAAEAVPLYDNLGRFSRPIATSSPLAQRYFDQGMRLTFGFAHGQAVRSFREAARLDPDCAMCWWGVAWASGPHINHARRDSASLVEAPGDPAGAAAAPTCRPGGAAPTGAGVAAGRRAAPRRAVLRGRPAAGRSDARVQAHPAAASGTRPNRRSRPRYQSTASASAPTSNSGHIRSVKWSSA